MDTTKTPTPLGNWLQLASDEERARMAMLAGTSTNYLYQLAGCHRGVPKADLALAIEEATVTLSKETDGRLPIVSMRDLATMCAVSGLEG